MWLRNVGGVLIRFCTLRKATVTEWAAVSSCLVVIAFIPTMVGNVATQKISPQEFEALLFAFMVPGASVLVHGILLMARKGDEATLLKGLLHAQRLAPLILLGMFAVPAIFPNDLATTEALQEITAGLGAFCLIIAVPYFITMYAIGMVEKGQKQGNKRPLTIRVQRSRIKRSGLAR